MATLIGFLESENVPIIYVQSPYVSDLKEARESWAPTIHAVASTYSNKLEEFKNQRGPTVYNRNLTVVWKTATTTWGLRESTANRYDLDADYEVDQDKTRLKTREYGYILRPPILEMTSIEITVNHDTFVWIPPIMLKDNTLKVLGDNRRWYSSYYN